MNPAAIPLCTYPCKEKKIPVQIAALLQAWSNCLQPLRRSSDADLRSNKFPEVPFKAYSASHGGNSKSWRIINNKQLFLGGRRLLLFH